MSSTPSRTIEVAARLAELAERVRGDTLHRAVAAAARSSATEVWVVGGTVRDALLGRDWHDLDLALPGDRVETLARRIGEQTGAAVVPLDPRLPTIRIVTPEGGRQIDLSGLRGSDIETDLGERDLTVNALAVSLGALVEGAAAALIDPCGGLVDLESRLARLPGPQVLASDPLRVLRVHRFAATLGLDIAAETRHAVRAAAPSLARVAVERILEELMKLMAAPVGGAWLAELHADGILQELFPEVLAMEGVSQNTFHHLDVLAHTFEACRQGDEVRGSPGLYFGVHGGRVLQYLDERRGAPLVTLALLLHDVAKPATRFVDDTGVHFHRHESVGAEMTDAIARRLRISTRERERLVSWVAIHLGLKDLISLHREGRLADKTVRRFLRRAGDDLEGLLCVVLADTRATRGPAFPPDGEALLLEVANRLFEADAARRADPFAMRPLLRGRDLIEQFGLEPGPELGRWLAAVEEARIDGDVRDRDQALAWLEDRLPPRV